MIIMDIEQGSPEWYEARRGIPTASEFETLLPKQRGAGKGRLTYMYKLAGERLTGRLMDSGSSAAMQRGKDWEEQARGMYKMLTNEEVTPCGFIRSEEAGGCGCSPDSLVGDDGLLEIKTKSPHLLIQCIVEGMFPEEHKAQCQGQLWISGRQWVDLVCYWPQLPVFIMRAERDEEYIANLRHYVSTFNEDLAHVVEAVRRYGD